MVVGGGKEDAKAMLDRLKKTFAQIHAQNDRHAGCR